MNTLEKVETAFVRANKALIGIMMALMFILVFFNVVGRYCFRSSFGTTEEISSFLMIWVTYLGAGLALREGRHAAIDLFQDLLPLRARRHLRAGLGVVILLFLSALAYYGIRFALFGWSQVAAATQIPKGLPYLGVPLGAAVCGMHLVLIFREWVGKQWDMESPEETVELKVERSG
ncbi:MAG: TRAP transporter small permease [Deltaproteobacteria bacterium]|nr:TRAP transporter small permease [Deltaproteobacteria bacterium]